MALLDDVKEVVAEQLCLEENEVKEDSRFIEDLDADSLDLVELIMALEEKFEIEICDEDAKDILTVKDAVEYVQENA